MALFEEEFLIKLDSPNFDIATVKALEKAKSLDLESREDYTYTYKFEVKFKGLRVEYYDFGDDISYEYRFKFVRS